MDFCDFEVVVDDLLQVHHALGAGGADHGFAEDVVDPEAPLVG